MILTLVRRLWQALRCAPTLRSRGGLFDARYYRSASPGAVARLFPYLHFMLAGAFAGRRPHPLFDTAFYLRRYPDVAASRVNPLCHYLHHGAEERRKPHPLFQPAHYLSQCQAARGSGANPLLHFLAAGAHAENPHPLFDCAAYLRANPGARDMNPLVHYVLCGRTSAPLEGGQFAIPSAASPLCDSYSCTTTS